MKFIISGKNIEVTPGLKDAIEQKLGKLERYFTPETEINVTLSVEKGRQKIEVTIPVKGNIIRSEQTSNDMYVSIDLVEEIIERQLRKYKNWSLVIRDILHHMLHQGTASEKNSLIQKKRQQKTMKSVSFVQRSLVLNQCFQKMLVFKWNFSDITSSYSPMQRQMKSMWYTKENMVHLV